MAIGSPPPALVTPPVIAPPPAPSPPPAGRRSASKPARIRAPRRPRPTSRRQRQRRQHDHRSGRSPTASRRRGRAARGAARAPGGSAADNRKQLEEAERLLRAERFTEARGIFTRLAKSRRDRGPALVGLAEISFQEKHYEEAVKSATRAADRGGGVRARVLLGDAHFRLNQFKEAAKAYEDALKLDPKNASARSGLALANKRM